MDTDSPFKKLRLCRKTTNGSDGRRFRRQDGNPLLNSLGNGNGPEQKDDPHQLAAPKSGLSDVVKNRNCPEPEAERRQAEPGGQCFADAPVTGNQDHGDQAKPDEAEVDINLQVAIMGFVDSPASITLPDMRQARTQPEGLVAGTQERIGAHVKEHLPQIGSSGEVGVAADHASHLAINAEAELQNQIGGKHNGYQGFKDGRIALNETQAAGGHD